MTTPTGDPRPRTKRCAWVQCGRWFDVSRQGPEPDYCGRTCQLKALRRRQSRSTPALRLELDPATLERLADHADRVVLSPARLAELMVLDAIETLDAREVASIARDRPVESP